MSDTNLSLILKKKEELCLEEQPIPEPGHGEVQLSMRSVGICGTDIGIWKNGGFNESMVHDCQVLGHEASGVVCKLGEGVTNLKVGDRVAIEPGVPCWRCETCINGRYNICPNMTFFGVPPHKRGAVARYLVHPSYLCFKLPDHVSFDEGAMVEPLAVATQACYRGNVTLGQKVLVCGAGPIAYMSLLAAKAMGASAVCVTGTRENRLEMAKKLGATYTVNTASGDPKSLARTIVDTMGCRPDVALECSGAEASIQTAVYATKPGGAVVLEGIGPLNCSVPVVNAAVREIDIKGSFIYPNVYPTCVEMIAFGAVDVKPVITHHFKLEDALEAYNTTRSRAGGALKVMIHCGKDWKED